MKNIAFAALLLAMGSPCLAETPHDQAMLRSLMQSARSDLASFAVTFDLDRLENGTHTSQRWATAWGPEGVRFDIATPYENSAAFPVDHHVCIFDVAASHAVIYDGISNAEVSASPVQLGLPYLTPEYCGFLAGR